MLTRSTRPTRLEIKPLVVSGLGLIFGFPLAMAIGLQTVPSYHGAVVLGILPLVTAGLSAFVHGYRARLGFWLCALTGAGLVILFTLKEQEGSVSWADLWLVLAALMASSGMSSQVIYKTPAGSMGDLLVACVVIADFYFHNVDSMACFSGYGQRAPCSLCSVLGFFNVLWLFCLEHRTCTWWHC